ncbi:hypothetical protein [Paractinoplanes durhamensis]|uniref:hypothetical protein n=1 Tax=Paractinoplanes durhamensis TaxID=113563 RepID=UPI00363853B1
MRRGERPGGVVGGGDRAIGDEPDEIGVGRMEEPPQPDVAVPDGGRRERREQRDPGADPIGRRQVLNQLGGPLPGRSGRRPPSQPTVPVTVSRPVPLSSSPPR